MEVVEGSNETTTTGGPVVAKPLIQVKLSNSSSSSVQQNGPNSGIVLEAVTPLLPLDKERVGGRSPPAGSSSTHAD